MSDWSKRKRWFRVNIRDDLKRVYDNSFLLESLARAAALENKTELNNLHLEAFKIAFPLSGFSGIFCTLEEVDPKRVVTNIFTYNESEIAREYFAAKQSHPELDFSSRARIEHPGKPLFVSEFMTRPEFEASLLFAICIKPLNMSDVFCMSYEAPYNEQKRLTLRFIMSNRSELIGAARQHDVEYLNLPFTFAWLRAMDLISHDKMLKCFQLISGLTPMQVALLREIASARQFNLINIADKFQISKRTLETHISTIYANMAVKLGFNEETDHRSVRLVDIAIQYSFFEFYSPVSYPSGLRAPTA